MSDKHNIDKLFKKAFDTLEHSPKEGDWESMNMLLKKEKAISYKKWRRLFFYGIPVLFFILGGIYLISLQNPTTLKPTNNIESKTIKDISNQKQISFTNTPSTIEEKRQLIHGVNQAPEEKNTINTKHDVLLKNNNTSEKNKQQPNAKDYALNTASNNQSLQKEKNKKTLLTKIGQLTSKNKKKESSTNLSSLNNKENLFHQDIDSTTKNNVIIQRFQSPMITIDSLAPLDSAYSLLKNKQDSIVVDSLITVLKKDSLIIDSSKVLINKDSLPRLYKWSIGTYSGVDYFMYRLKTDASFINSLSQPHNFKLQNVFQASAGFIISRQLTNKLSVFSGVICSENKVLYKDYSEPTLQLNYTINTQSLQLPISLRYYFKADNYKPYIQAGVLFDITLNNDSWDLFRQAPNYDYLESYPANSNYRTNFMGGIGIETNLRKRFSYYIESSFIYGKTSQFHKTYSLPINYYLTRLRLGLGINYKF